MRVCFLYTGGKDSCYALHWAIMHGFEPGCLVSIRPPGWDSFLFHYPGLELVQLHSKALGIPLLQTSISGAGEDKELAELVAILKRCKIGCRCEGIVTGALLSDYQRLRFAVAAEEAGLRVYTPLWRINQENYMRELIKEGFKVLVLSVQAYGLPEWIVGKVLDEELVEEIIHRARIYGFNPAFEGGEAETLVIDAPLFKYKLHVVGERVRLGPYHVVYSIKEAKLVSK